MRGALGVVGQQGVTKWKQQGVICLWRYQDNTKNYPGWHCTADRLGCNSILELLRLMKTAECPVRRTVRVSPPSADVLGVPNNRRARWKAAASLDLGFDRRANPDLWQLGGDDRVILRLGLDRLAAFAAGVGGILEGKGDFSIGEEAGGPVLWLWWWPRDERS